jgi:hypothetical protein
MCGALDCPNCYPGTAYLYNEDEEQEEQEEEADEL